MNMCMFLLDYACFLFGAYGIVLNYLLNKGKAATTIMVIPPQPKIFSSVACNDRG